jgi:hypothetical protein
MLLSVLHSLPIKNYVLQTRATGQSWRNYNTFHSLDEAAQAQRALARQKPALELRIYNRVTGRTVRP